jgi:prepilin-type N-terminal cleavage/methylation domain-containing protein
MTPERNLRSPTARARPGSSGFTLLELMIVLIVLTICMGMFSSTIVSTARQSRLKRETSTAAEAGRRMLEILRSENFGEIFRRYNADPGDDPGGAGTAPGRGFAVEGLTPTDGDEDGLAGEIRFPSDGPELREDGGPGALGMPRDLSGDSEIDGDDHSGDYLILPVQIRVRWRGMAGERTFDIYSQLVDM